MGLMLDCKPRLAVGKAATDQTPVADYAIARSIKLG